MIVLGIMNGTSVDGIDYVWVQKNKTGWKLLDQKHRPFPKKIRESLVRATLDQCSSHELGRVHYDLGRLYCTHLKKMDSKLLKKTKLIGLHGQTVFHQGKVATLQIGEPSFMSAQFKVPVVHQFRNMNVALKGEGAPFAPIFHKELLKGHGLPVAFHNLGGISNLSYFSKKISMALDTGPANVLMDLWLQKKKKILFDKNGSLASKGLAHGGIIQKMKKHPYFAKKGLKSCGREEFNLDYVKRYAGPAFNKLTLPDQIATLCELSALTLFESYQKNFKELPKTIYFSGGGTKNPYFMKRLKIYFSSHSQVKTSEDLGWPASSIEGATFAYLAYERFHKRKVDMKFCTGAPKSLLGQIVES